MNINEGFINLNYIPITKEEFIGNNDYNIYKNPLLQNNNDTKNIDKFQKNINVDTIIEQFETTTSSSKPEDLGKVSSTDNTLNSNDCINHYTKGGDINKSAYAAFYIIGLLLLALRFFLTQITAFVYIPIEFIGYIFLFFGSKFFWSLLDKSRECEEKDKGLIAGLYFIALGLSIGTSYIYYLDNNTGFLSSRFIFTFICLIPYTITSGYIFELMARPETLVTATSNTTVETQNGVYADYDCMNDADVAGLNGNIDTRGCDAARLNPDSDSAINKAYCNGTSSIIKNTDAGIYFETCCKFNDNNKTCGMKDDQVTKIINKISNVTGIVYRKESDIEV